MAFPHQNVREGYSPPLSPPVPKMGPPRTAKGFHVTRGLGSHWHAGPSIVDARTSHPYALF